MEPVGSSIAGTLLLAVKDVGTKKFDFKTHCQNLQGILEILIPTLEEVANNQLQDDRKKAFEEFCVKLQTGITLLQDCSKVGHLDIFRTYRYAKKLERLNRDIVRFIQTMDLTPRYGEIQEISHGILRAKIDKVMEDHMDQLENGKSASPLSIPKLPDCSDGLEISVGELKKPLLSEDVQLLGELEMGSSSNTHRDPLEEGESASPSSIPKLPDCSDGLEISVGELKKPLLSEDVQLLGELETAFRNDKEFQDMLRQNPLRQFDVFINHRGSDVKNNLASFIYHLLTLKHPNLRVFLDNNGIPYGANFEFAIETAIQSSSVHIAIFSEHYAESTWCLRELDLIIKSRRKLIPVFCDLDPEALRRIEKGCYERAFEKHRKRECVEKTKRWEDALARASDLQGLSLKMNEEDLGYCAVKIADIVTMNLKEESLVDAKYQGAMRQNPGLQFDVFINFMGMNVKNRLASFIYHLLTIKDPNLRVYLDKNDIPSGVDFSYAIETAIQSSSVHIAIFSKRYAQSKWCLHELDLIIKSKRKLIPVFCDVDPAALRRIEKGCYEKAFKQHRGKEPLEKTERWEDALARASYLQGLPLKMKETNIGDFAVKIADIVLTNLKEGS